jgi:hypothetical protein
MLQAALPLNPYIIYFPVYTENDIDITKDIPKAGITNPALMSSGGLISEDFKQKTQPNSDGMYLSGPAEVGESVIFKQKYKARYTEDPITAYYL